MNSYLLVLLWIFIIVVIIVVVTGKKWEGFETNYGYYKRYCGSCGWRSRFSCGKCSNCGYCIRANGLGECVPGDSNGPYFATDCMFWEYGDPYAYASVSNIYPIVQVRNIYPSYRYRMRKPYRWTHKQQEKATKN